MWNMYRLLIVDDEEIITDGLYEVFANLDSVELEVYKAYSGEEALSLLNRIRIDIVLSDICMPGMDGLQLVSHIRQTWPACKVVFLTGHNEFDYIYKAIQYEDVHYILKTEGYGRIIAYIEKLAAEIDRERIEKQSLEKARDQLKQMNSMLQKELLQQLLTGRVEAKHVEQQLKELHIPLSAEIPIILAVGRLDDPPEQGFCLERSKLLLQINLLADPYLSNHMTKVYVEEDQSCFLWMIQPMLASKDPSRAEDFEGTIRFLSGTIELIQESCREMLRRSVSFVVDDRTVAWEELPNRYTFLKMLIHYRIGEGRGMLLTDRKAAIGHGKMRTWSAEGSRRSWQNNIELLKDYLESGHRQQFENILECLTGEFSQAEDVFHAQVQQGYYSIALIFLDYINRWELAEKLAFSFNYSRLMRLTEHQSWGQAAVFLKELGNHLMLLQESDEKIRACDAVSRVQRHIQEHLDNHDELTLLRLSEMVYFNPSYLSRLFKQETGVNLSDYIWSISIKKAKELLHDPELKIRDAAKGVGYDSSANFSRFFKRFTGQTPQEYRDFINR